MSNDIILEVVQEEVIIEFPSQQGPPGLSAYAIAVANGFEGTEQEWLDSLAAGGNPNWGDIDGTLTDQADLQAALSAKQALDNDLTSIAGLTPANDDIIQRKSGAWTNRTMAQLKADLSLVKADVGLGNVDNTSDANKPISTVTQTALDGKANSLGVDDNYVTDAEKVKLSNLSGVNTGDQIASTVANTPNGNLAATTVQGAVNELQGDIDVINSSLLGLTDVVVLKGLWDASAGTFPGAGSAQAGRSYIVSVAGTVGGVAFAQNDRLLAITENASTSTYANNWHKLDYTDQVLSVNGETGAVILDADDISDSATTHKFTTASEISKLAAIEALADVTDAGNVGSSIHGSAAKTTPVDADTFTIIDSEAGNVLKKLSRANIKTTIKAYYDAVTSTLTNKAIDLANNTITGTKALFNTALSDGNFLFESDLDTDGTLAANSDVKVATQKATKTYADAREVAAKAYADTLVVGLVDDRGNYNASGNVFPSAGGSGTAGAILKGDLWTVSVAGTLGGHAVTAGDLIRALVDTPGQTDANWAITENNIGYVAENQSNKENTTLDTSTTKYPTNRLAKEYADAKVADAINNGTSTIAPSQNAVYDALALKADLAGGTFSGDISVPDEAYDATGWNGSTEVPTKNAIRDKIESMSGGGTTNNVTPTARLATTAALAANTYSAGVLTGTATGVLTVDGVTVALNDVILVKNEATGANNGLYTCTTAGAVGVAYVLTRHTSMDASGEFVGAIIPIASEGTLNKDTVWRCTNTSAPTVGTTAITFTWEKRLRIKCRVYATGTTTLTTSGTWYAVAFAGENFDTFNMHDTSTNNTRINFPITDTFMVGASVRIDGNVACGARIILNGTTVLATQKQGNSGNPEHVNVSTTYDFTAGDYIEVQAINVSPGSPNVSGTSDTSFWAFNGV